MTQLTSGLSETTYNTITALGGYISGINGGYIKIGNLVIVNIRCTVDTETPNSWTNIFSGLPYSIIQYGQGGSGASLINNKFVDMAVTGTGLIVAATTIPIGTLVISGVYMTK